MPLALKQPKQSYAGNFITEVNKCDFFNCIFIINFFPLDIGTVYKYVQYNFYYNMNIKFKFTDY